MPSYRYEPIGRNSFTRVLQLHGNADHEAPLCCDIQQWRSSEPPYEALSYAWGSPDAKEILLCNSENHSLPISSALGTALRALRKPVETRTLWVDAICINQLDDVEKAQQVRVMSRIYRRASNVILWLGHDYENGAKVLDVFHQFGKVYSGFRDRPDHGGDQSKAHEAVRTVGQVINEAFGELGLEPFQLMFQRPWFKRRWVIQEAILARHAVFQCGSATISIASFAACALAMNLYYGQQRGMHVLEPRFLMDEHLSDTLRGIAKENRNKEPQGMTPVIHQFPIFRLLLQFSAAQCSDDRDRIYALLGLSDDVVAEPIGLKRRHSQLKPSRRQLKLPITYAGKVEDLYAQFAIMMINRQYPGPSGVLHLAGAFRASVSLTRTGSLPSWIPDWRTPLRFLPLEKVWHDVQPDVDSDDEWDKYEWRVCDNGNKLILSGWKHSVVSEKLDASHDCDISSSDGLRQTVQEWVRFYLGNCLLDCQDVKAGDTWLVELEDWFCRFFDCVTMGRTKWLDKLMYPPAGFAELLFEGLLERPTGFESDQSRSTGWTVSAASGEVEDGPALPASRKKRKRAPEANKDATEKVPTDGKPLQRNTDMQFRSCTRTLVKMIKGRSLFKTEEGTIINCPSDTEVGDVVAAFYHVDSPFVLRPLHQRRSLRVSKQPVEEYRLIGDCYIDGLMGREDFEKVQNGDAIQFAIV